MSDGLMGKDCVAMRWPESKVGDIWIRETPVCVSPIIRAHSAGIAPRYLGKREKWMLMGVNLGRLSQEDGNNLP